MAKKDRAPGPTKVRMLLDYPVDGVPYRADALVVFDAAIAAWIVDGGIADDALEAVAYLESQGVQAVEHVAAAA